MTRLHLTSGQGPAECRIALSHALQRMIDEARQMGVTLDIARGRDPDGHGPLSAVVFVRGAGADAFIVRWQGTLKWVCKSPVRPTHKRKNWFIGCFELDDEDDAVEGIANGDVRF